VISRISKQRKQGLLNKPFISPIQNEDRNLFRIGLSQGSKQFRPRAVRDPIMPSAPLVLGSYNDGLIEEPSPARTIPVHPDMDKLLDYERELQAAKQTQAIVEAEPVEEEPNRSNINGITYPTPSPHSNRYQAAKAALTSINVSPPSFESGDPHAYSIRLTQPGPTGAVMPPPRRIGRAKTMTLPLETVPLLFRVHDLSTVVRTTVESVEQIEKAVASADAYVISGKAIYAFPTDTGGVSEVEAALKEMIHRAYQNETGETADLNIDLKMLTTDT
jgi:hypothetical protein